MSDLGKIFNDMFGGGPKEFEMPPEAFFNWLIIERVASRGPDFSLALRHSCKQANIAAQHAREQKNPVFERWAREYADAFEKVSRFNAAHTLAVIEELERMSGIDKEAPPIIETAPKETKI